jgi:hypothetical protein
LTDQIDLRDLVKDLTRAHKTPVYWHGEFVRFRPDPPLLDALRAARTGNIGNAAGGSGNAAHERTTLNLAASELYGSIQKRVKAWAMNADVPRHWAMQTGTHVDWTDASQLLSAWHVRVQGDAHFDERAFASTLRGWIGAIEDLILDPPRRWVLAAACPSCNARWVVSAEGIGWIGLDQNGDRLSSPWAIAEGEQVDALAVTERDPVHDSTVVCRNCEAVWQGVEGADGARKLAIAIDDAARIAS